MSSTILITGATGNTGSSLLQLLAARGVPVRAMVRHERDVARLGNTSASIVIGDFDDAGSLAVALKGIYSDARVSAVDVRDIAAVAAAALTEPGHIRNTYTITGPSAVTHAEIAQAIGEAIGREVTFVEVSPEDFAAALSKLGVPAWQVEGLVEDYAHYARGEASEVHPTVSEITGTDARNVTAFARDYASAFSS